MVHEYFMQRCLELAARGRGAVGNGALVGAVLVRDEHVIAEGYHRDFGGPHAERSLLESFHEEIMPADILYVNLEPCCHHGKTPPCTDIIAERGVNNIVYGMKDPDARVAGKGIETLKIAGAVVTGPVLLPLCERLNRGFISVRKRERPWITLKSAQTKDGRVSNGGVSLKITSHDQDVWAHTYLRSTHDAVLAGVGTVIADDPMLDARLDEKKRDEHPYRIVLDPHLKLPLNARIVTDDYRGKTIIVHAPIVTREAEDAMMELVKRGVMLREVPMETDSFDWGKLWVALTAPSDDFHGITSVLVEGGPKTWEVFRSSGMVDEEVILIGK